MPDTLARWPVVQNPSGLKYNILNGSMLGVRGVNVFQAHE